MWFLCVIAAFSSLAAHSYTEEGQEEEEVDNNVKEVEEEDERGDVSGLDESVGGYSSSDEEDV